MIIQIPEQMDSMYGGYFGVSDEGLGPDRCIDHDDSSSDNAGVTTVQN